MERTKWFLPLVVGAAMLAPSAVWAAAIDIDDTSPNETITITVNDFEFGFSVNGAQIQQGLNNPQSVTLPESAGEVLFSGSWIDNGQVVPVNRTIYLLETRDRSHLFDTQISDILRYTTDSAGGRGFINGGFISSPPSGPGAGGLGLVPTNTNPADIFVEDGTPVLFDAAFLTGAVRSDPVPEPSTLLLCGLSIAALAALARKKRAAKQCAA